MKKLLWLALCLIALPAVAAMDGTQILQKVDRSRPNLGTDYLYFRAQQKDTLGIVYFQAAVTAMMNVRDRSYQVTPELLYTGVKNFDLRARLYLLQGGAGTEFGEKLNSRKLELYARYYF